MIPDMVVRGLVGLIIAPQVINYLYKDRICISSAVSRVNNKYNACYMLRVLKCGRGNVQKLIYIATAINLHLL